MVEIAPFFNKVNIKVNKILFYLTFIYLIDCLDHLKDLSVLIIQF